MNTAILDETNLDSTAHMCLNYTNITFTTNQ